MQGNLQKPGHPKHIEHHDKDEYPDLTRMVPLFRALRRVLDAVARKLHPIRIVSELEVCSLSSERLRFETQTFAKLLDIR